MGGCLPCGPWACCGCCGPCCCCKSKCCAAGAPPALQKPAAASPVDEVNGGFTIKVRGVAGTTWTLPRSSKDHRIGEVKERLVAEDMRFRTHRVDLVVGSRVLGDLETLGECGVTPSTRLVAVFTDLRAVVLVIGGGAAGRAAIAELSPAFPDQWIVLVDAQEYFEHPCGVLRAYADPSSWEAIVAPLEDAVSSYSNVRFVQGEVSCLRPGSATVIPSRDKAEFTVRFDYCIVATGCSFGAAQDNESLWKPTSTSAAIEVSGWPWLDERTVAGRRMHIVEEHRKLWSLHDKGGNVLVVGADYHGVEWACDLKHYFPQLRVTLVDDLPRCLGTLPVRAAEYAEQYMAKNGIRTFYSIAYDPKNPQFWADVGLPSRADITYTMKGYSPRNTFMPTYTLSRRGPGGGGWIITNSYLQVCHRASDDRPAQLWAGGRIYAVGDCHYGVVVNTKSKSQAGKRDDPFARFSIKPVPKTALAASCWASLACRNVAAMAAGWPLEAAKWPHEAGIIAMSLGEKDGIVAWKVKWARDSGEVVLFDVAAKLMKQRFTWPSDREWLFTPSQWLATFKEGIPAGSLLAERVRGALRMQSRAW